MTTLPYPDDILLSRSQLDSLDFTTPLATVTLVDFKTKEPILYPIRRGENPRVLYVFSETPQEDVEAMADAAVDAGLTHITFQQVWQVTRRQLEIALATPGVIVVLDLPVHFAEYREYFRE